jgi:hypothetical protein
MTEDQANRVIELLEQMNQKLDDVNASIMMWSDVSNVVDAINALRADLQQQ